MKNGKEIDEYGTEYWYKDDALHREDGPAVISPFGDSFWYKNGIHHRDDGPAVIWNDYSLEWFLDGLRHREDGPAVVYKKAVNAPNEYWLHDELLSFEEWLERISDKNKLLFYFQDTLRLLCQSLL